MAVCFVLAPLVALAIKDNPGEIGMLPDGEKHTAQEKQQGTPESASNTQIPGWTLPRTLQISTLWILIISFMMVFMGTALVLAHAVPFFVGQGFSNQVASTILGRAIGVSVPGRIITGYLSDRIPVKYIAALFFIFQVGGLLALIFPETQANVSAFVAIFGMAMGGLFVLEPLIVRDYFGLDSFAPIYGGLWAFQSLGCAAGPYITGCIFDMTRSYNLAFIASLLSPS